MIFQGRASVVIDLSFSIEANSLEEAKEKIIDAECMEFDITTTIGNTIFEDFDINDWYIVDETQQGNIQQSGIHDFKIWEEEE